MSIPPPVKPPRGIKPTKESNDNRLITVIRALSASETNEQREIEKAKLEKEYKRSDQRLDELVSLHDQDLTEVMRIFSVLSERVTAAREKIHGVKENLNACKHLLRCRREELMKLWLEGIEHKHVLQLLTDIDQLREIPTRLNNYLEKKHYLHATQLLVSAMSMGKGVLDNVEGLREVRMELETKKQLLNTKLLEEMNKQFYKENPKEEMPLKRQGSGRDFQRGNEARNSKGNKTSFISKNPNPFTQDVIDVVEDEDVTNPEENPEYFIPILIDCLALLNKIPETVEIIKAQMQTELLNIAKRTSKRIKDSMGKNRTVPEEQKVDIFSTVDIKVENQQQSPLLELLEAIFKQFQVVADVHVFALKRFQIAAKKYNANVNLYDQEDVWRKIQTVIQMILTEYLDIQNVVDGPCQTPKSLNTQKVNLNMYFYKKKWQKPKPGKLFEFESSSVPMAMNSYFKEHRYSSLIMKENDQNSSTKNLVCEPDPKNITLIYRPMMKFVTDLEAALGCYSLYTLNSFIADYVKEVYLGRLHISVATTIDKVTRSSDAWRTQTSPEVMRELGLSRPLLDSTVKVEQCLAKLRSVMVALPIHSDHFCTLTLNVLHNYRETCHAAYKQIVQPNGEDNRICSAAWLKDDDISRFIKSLPNWEILKIERFPSLHLDHRVKLRRQLTLEESPEEVRQRNVREAEILASNLGEGGINATEILSDVGQLRSLALIQESTEWFSKSVKSLVEELYDNNNPDKEYKVFPEVQPNLIKSIEKVAEEFDELADTCILLLHLEVRVQCFHYLRPRREYSQLCGSIIKDHEDADPRVEELSRVLQHIDEALQPTLHPAKTKYIFEGLGQLIAKIMITSAQYVDKIDDSGIRRMCRSVFTLQQTLSNITMSRELALDSARQYFELFYETPEEIIDGVLENGPKFSELEYMNAFQLISRSKPEYTSVSKYLEKLSEILGEVGVIV